MNDYSKWDKLVDSDDEVEEVPRKADENREQFDELLRAEQAGAEQWLRRNIALLKKTEEEPKYSRHDAHAAPELLKNSQVPYRNVSRDEIRVLAMLLVITNFEEGETNLIRHPQILDLVRHHRWLEGDPGTLELLCRIHNLNMKQTDDKHRPPAGSPEAELDFKHRSMCLCAINTLAGPEKAKRSGGLLELINLICTPATPEAHELRLKWQKKEFGKDALFDSLFPDLKQYKDTQSTDNDWWEIWLMLAFIILIIVILGFLMVYGLPLTGSNTSTTTTPSVSDGKPEL
eukprot:TRINITY_DN87255_c0_g1_i1.p1 TRINITY_DN87255_c0_g1~~TRINITY_DN87255_c0_g1_i1.p1  ORF type:complete len:288 (+),score=73.60 TRINITY_DN87255_c0_g1_i1:48-911(+)